MAKNNVKRENVNAHKFFNVFMNEIMEADGPLVRVDLRVTCKIFEWFFFSFLLLIYCFRFANGQQTARMHFISLNGYFFGI